MRNIKDFKFLTFFPLAGAVYLFRETQGGILPFAMCTALVILFWYGHSMKFAFNSFRTIAVLLAGLGLILYAFGDRIGLSSASYGKVDGRTALDLNPAMISRLKTSHEIALELFLDHRPTEAERYFKTGTFSQTDDGLHYSIKKTGLDLSRLPKAQAWVQKNLQQASVEKTAAAIEAWWSEGFGYLLTPGAFKESHPMDEFLFVRKIGFCEHFAASLATLLKLKGFESRVVVGYSGGSWNPILQKLTYEDADAHAWVEARDSNTKTWIRLDPTLWVSPAENQRGPDLSTLWTLLAWTVGLSFAFFAAQIWRRDPRERFFRKLEKLEKRHQFTTASFTVAERIERLIARQPNLSLRLSESLNSYREAYFAAEPDRNSMRQFSRTLQSW